MPSEKPAVVTVRNFHLDGYGHVNHARYLEFLEDARWLFFEQRQLTAALGNTLLVVARADIRYRRAAQAGDVLEINSRILSAEPRRILVGQQIAFADGHTAAEAEITLMPVNPQGRSTRLPPEFIQRLSD